MNHEGDDDDNKMSGTTMNESSSPTPALSMALFIGTAVLKCRYLRPSSREKWTDDSDGASASVSCSSFPPPSLVESFSL
jgi:hypothetical protein